MSAKPDTNADMVTIEIDGVEMQAPKGAMIIEAADDANIYIPRFCYHKKLPIAANCRMCLVQVENVPKPLPACATPVNDGMKVFTRSEFARRAQKGVMEFLLINHPLDCPICDQGGECELQDIAMGYGSDVSRYSEQKRVVADKNIGPLIETEMTRCIHCTRCIRTIELVGGEPELGGMGRGDRLTIGTYIERSIDSEMSGNVIDVCPVGALTAKPSRFGARAWELRAHDGLSAHDCIGSNTEIHTWQGKIMRTVPAENEAINEVWLSDRDRYAYEGINSSDRLETPMIKRNGEWTTVDWSEALDAVADGLRAANGSIGALMSPSSTVEEAWLMQQLVRGLGSNNIDHRLRQQDFSADSHDPVAPVLGRGIEDLEHIDACLLIGSHISKDQPIAAHRLRKAANSGARIMMVSGADYTPNYPLAANIITSPANLVGELAAVAKALLEITREAEPQGLAGLLDGVEVNDTHRAIADRLKLGTNAIVVIGMQAMAHPQYAMLRQLASQIAGSADAGFGFLTQGANAVGMSLAGALPHQGAGLNAMQMLSTPQQAYVLFGIEPEHDCADPLTARKALDDADFVTVMTPFVTDEMRAYATVLLPVAPYSETSGTFVNAAGTWQSFAGSARPVGETRPGWKVLRVLGNSCELDGFDQLSSEEVLQDARNAIGDVTHDTRVDWQQPTTVATETGITRISDMPSYGIDAVVRRATALQHTTHAARETARMNAATIARLGLADSKRVLVCEGDECASLELECDESVPDSCVALDATTEAAAKLGAAYNNVTVEQD
ncbi:MAG: NADH-quinone oxidoreductase subunit NuoG [Granulosicoccaceae bacterium]|jgi:NADH-quinone oxidoreductase subunit G